MGSQKNNLFIKELEKASESMEKLADKLAELLNCPITIEDSNHFLISYSSINDDIIDIDEARISTIIRRKVPDKVINGLWKSGTMYKLFESDEPVIIPAIKEVGLGDRVAISVRKNNEILGFIWVHAYNESLNNMQLELLKVAVKYVKEHILKSPVRKRENSYNNFFWQLLLGQLKNGKEIFRRANDFGIDLDGNLSVVVIEFGYENLDKIEKYANYLVDSVIPIQLECRLFDQNQLLLLVKSSNTEDMSKQLNKFIVEFIQTIQQRLGIKHINASAGTIVSSVEHIHVSYKQAIKVLGLKRKYVQELNHIYLYQELGVFQFIEELQDIKQGDLYKNEHIERLRTYDEKSETDLLKTLKVYLECDSNVRLASEKMFIHMNTMNYRLKRITEVSGIDLKNMNHKVTAYLDLLTIH